MFSTEADVFFESPSQSRPSPDFFGVLYLLRRDVFRCLGVNPSTGSSTGQRTLWPGAMGILAGVDLLAKFLAGSDQRGRVGRRFRDFVSKYFQPISTGEEDVIYQLRNSLLHSFGLYSEDKGKVYRFTLSAQRLPLTQHTPPDTYKVDLVTLHQKFENAVSLYEKDLDSDVQLQQNFMRMFPKYGAIWIG